MQTIKGYMVRMWTSDGRTHSEKFFHSGNMLEARKEAFTYGFTLSHIMDEARKAGVINYNTPGEILDPEAELEKLVIGNVFISVVYEDRNNELNQTDEDIIHMILYPEDDMSELSKEEEKIALQKTEVFDPFDSEVVRIRNREAWYYIRTGGFKAIRIINSGGKPFFLLMDDYQRLKEKNLISN